MKKVSIGHGKLVRAATFFLLVEFAPQREFIKLN